MVLPLEDWFYIKNQLLITKDYTNRNISRMITCCVPERKVTRIDQRLVRRVIEK